MASLKPTACGLAAARTRSMASRPMITAIVTIQPRVLISSMCASPSSSGGEAGGGDVQLLVRAGPTPGVDQAVRLLTAEGGEQFLLSAPGQSGRAVAVKSLLAFPGQGVGEQLGARPMTQAGRLGRRPGPTAWFIAAEPHRERVRSHP